MKKYFSFLLILIFLLPLTLAHLDGGQDIQIDNFVSDLGYSIEEPKMGDELYLLFSLNEDGVEIPITHAWVRIAKEDEIFFIGDLYAEDHLPE